MINYIENTEINDEGVFKDIIKYKHEPGKTKLKDCKKEIFEDYLIYKQNSGALQKVIPDIRIPDETKRDLIKTYNSNPSALQKSKLMIKKNLPNILRAKCPYCLISAHSTFDHYLDKSKYPEYALFSSNLIPSCAECNSLKSDFLCDSKGNRLFINFIFDELPAYPFLKYILSIEGEKIVLKKVYLDFDDNEPKKQIIKNHFKKLKLIPRLEDQFDVAISTIIEEFHEYNYSTREVKEVLTKKMRAWEKTRGINNWETCILRAIIQNNEVLQYLSKNEK